jgi:hypothetical protein
MERAAAHAEEPGGQPLFGGLGRLLGELFPRPQPRDRPAGERALLGAVQLLVTCLGAVVLLARYARPWQTIWAEDLWVYLPDALAHPWSGVFTPYAGYLQLVPRLVGQFVSLLPLREAAAGFAVAGAGIAAACALFVYHASAGHVRSPLPRAVLGASVILLPVALIEIADNGVNTPWYLMFALFWGLLWRPRTRTAMAVAALAGFAAASSNILASVFVVLVAARVIALPRLSEHAVTAGWLAGCLLQVPFFVSGLLSPHSQTRIGPLARPGQAVSFYGHDVLVPAFGWHVALWLHAVAGRNGAMLIVGGILAAASVALFIFSERRVRLFTVTALGFGFVLAVVAATLTWWVSVIRVTATWEPGARYTTIPILGIDSVAVVAVGAYFERARRPLLRVLAVLGLVAVLGAGWATDFRYPTSRTTAWSATVSGWLRTCRHHATVDQSGIVIPCSALRE